MPKRARDQDDGQHSIKKPKTNGIASAPEEIHFARQLQDLLTFSQDGVQQLRNGIASFKAFLEKILYHKNDDDRARQLSILREYLDTQKPADIKDTEKPFLSQLWQAWSFASQNNDDRLVSSISSILTLLLKTLSSLIDFREHGYLLARTVLQHHHLRLIKRCLDAPKHKDFLISPCLRLLNEVTSFDGGILAREVYKRREQTFDFATLRRNLGLIRSDVQDEEDARRRPAIRTLAIRYILAHLKYLHEGGKIDILKSRPLCTSLFHFLHDDPAEIVQELLLVTEQNVLKDNELPRSAKAALLVQQNLERVTEIATRSYEGHEAAEKAYSWLKAVCINSSYGVLRSSGWYPPGTAKLDPEQRDEKTIDLGLDSIEFYDAYDKPQVRNTTLLGWIQTLRPQSNLQERELILTCFSSAPELVAAYFAEKSMQLEPKLSNTWIGYASFLFEVVQLSIPEHFGNEAGFAQLPPQTSIIMESVLPRPLTQKVLTRCLNQNSELITFFAVRLLVLEFDKMSRIQSLLAQGATASQDHQRLWQEASDRLLSRFVSICPAMKDVVSTFRKIPDDDEHALQREAVTRLLQLYYEVTPLQAMEEQFDISTPLTTALERSESEDAASEIRELRQLELEHLLQIAQRSPGMRWLTKQGSLEYSPLVTLIKMHCKNLGNRNIRGLICTVLLENNIVSSNAGCDALLAALQDKDYYTNIRPFLDDCLSRASRQPVKYLDSLDVIVVENPRIEEKQPDVSPSLLALVFLEQTPFVVAKPKDVKKELMEFIASYFGLLLLTSENSPTLNAVWKQLTSTDGFAIRKKALKDPEEMLKRVQLPETLRSNEEKSSIGKTEAAAINFPPPPSESENHPELFKWSQKDLDMALEDGDIHSLILCLCSQYPDIRRQALTQLNKLEDQLLNSTIEDRDPVYILIGELIETFEQHCVPDNEALPYLAGCFATHALRVQTDPGHFLYPKINKFLNRGPSWRINKLPTYWIENTILSQPEEDDGYWREVQWVLDWLVDGLRTPADLEVLRKTGTFEKVMSPCSSPGVNNRNQVRGKVLELVWRATFIEDGSTTLITRTGVLAWLEMMGGEGASVEKKLNERIIATCDKRRIEEWSSCKIEEL